MVQHVEEVYVEANHKTLPDWNGLEEGGIESPLPGAWKVLLAPRMQVVIERGALSDTVVERDPDVVGVPESAHNCISRGIRRQCGRAPRDQRRSGRLVISRNSHDPIRLAVCIDAIDPVRRYVPVPPQV